MSDGTLMIGVILVLALIGVVAFAVVWRRDARRAEKVAHDPARQDVDTPPAT